MSNINNLILQNIERSKQLERQKKAQKARGKRKQEAIARDRKIIIGKIVSEYFPEVLRFQPCRSNAENETEFAPFIRFLTELSKDKKYISMLKEKVVRNQ